MMTTRRVVGLTQAGLLVAGLMVWTAASRWFGAANVPSPFAVAARLAGEGTESALWEHAATTLFEAIGGLLVGLGLGISTAVALRHWSRLGDAVDPVLTSVMGLPKLALAPVVTLWFGIGLASKIAFVAFAVFFIVFFSMQTALRAVDPTLVAMARLVGAREWEVTRHVLVPSTVPFLFGTLKLVLPHSITIAVVAELIVSRAGLGYYIKTCAAQADSVGIFSGVTMVMAIVVGAGALLQRAERRWLDWS